MFINTLDFDDLLCSTQMTQNTERYLDNFIKANSINNSRQSLPVQPPFITQTDLDKWWSKQKEILLVEFEKIIEQKINEYNNINRERQNIHFTNNQ